MEPMESNFVTVPQGEYHCRIAEVREGTTRAGDARWSLRIVVVGGELDGKQAAWDSLVFNVRGRSRLRYVLKTLGIAASDYEIKPTCLEGKEALVTVRPYEYLTPEGHKVVRNEVPYDGWKALGV